MKRPFAISLLAGGMLYSTFAAAQMETGNAPKDRSLDEVVVTGTRNETDAAQLSATVSVIDRKQIEQANTPSLLPILTEQVPGLFVSSRGIMGYGVSGGAAGEINLRGISGSSGRLMVLIDGHPQYMGLMGHPIADAYQALMAEKVEVLRGPASVLYGSNAMGGVINIITRKMQTEGISTHAHVGYGSYKRKPPTVSVKDDSPASSAVRTIVPTGTAQTWVSSNMAGMPNSDMSCPQSGKPKRT